MLHFTKVAATAAGCVAVAVWLLGVVLFWLELRRAPVVDDKEDYD